jgi:hypothetical protein
VKPRQDQDAESFEPCQYLIIILNPIKLLSAFQNLVSRLAQDDCL